jgi:hypothetical protein
MREFFIGVFVGGYFVPFTINFFGIYHADRADGDRANVMESLLTAFVGAALWPIAETRYEGE